MKYLKEYSVFDELPHHDYNIEEFYHMLKNVKQDDFEVLWDERKRILFVQGSHKFLDSHIMAHVMLAQKTTGKFTMSMKVLQYEPGVAGASNLINEYEEVPENIMKIIHESPDVFFQNIFDSVA